MRQLLSANTAKNNETDHCWSNFRFYSNACHVCRVYGEKVELKRCTRCKMIAYCGREHQRKDWPRHKELCSILGGIVQKAGSVFLSRGQVPYSDRSWERAKANLILLVQIKLGRTLLHSELTMLQFPRSCSICHETETSKLVDCTDCPFTSFCLDHRSDNRHEDKCKTCRLCFYTDIWKEKVYEPELLQDIGKNHPNGMREIVRLYEPVYKIENGIKPAIPALDIWEALVSEYLTRPYTFMYALKKLKLCGSSDITVHVIGADTVELISISFWETLLHYENAPKRLTMVFIGPSLVYRTLDTTLCRICAANGCELIVRTVGDFYVDYANDERFLKPDYVIGFNLGIHEYQNKENDAWAPSIPILAQQSCPFFMTSYTRQESTDERERLNFVLDKDVQFLYTGRNPFSSLRPYRDFENEDFFYENQYLTIYEKLC